MSQQHLMTTAEVADYLRIKERKVYDLVASGKIPCTRVTGKLLFPKPLINLWIASGTSGISVERSAPRPMIAAGSHDPLLDWALRRADSGIATLFDGSLDGLRRFLDGDALFCGLHVPKLGDSVPFEEETNVHLFSEGGQGGVAASQVVLIEWARREQGLILPPGNPMRIGSLKDLALKGARLRPRQPEAGSRVLMEGLIVQAGLQRNSLNLDETVAQSETEAATAVADGEVDAAFGIAAAAKRFNLDFVPLATERYDLAVERRDYFDPPFQSLLTVTRDAAFRAQAEKLGGYDVSSCGRVVMNG